MLLKKVRETRGTRPKAAEPQVPRVSRLLFPGAGNDSPTVGSQGSTGGNHAKPREKNKGVKGFREDANREDKEDPHRHRCSVKREQNSVYLTSLSWQEKLSTLEDPLHYSGHARSPQRIQNNLSISESLI